MSDDLDTAGAVAAYMGGQGLDATTPLRASLNAAVDANPDREAALQAAARRTGVSSLAARIAPEEVQRAAKVAAVDFDGLINQFPQTASWLVDPERARVSHDDIGALQTVETALSAAARWAVSAPDAPRGGLVADVGRAFGAGWAGVQSGGAGLYGATAAPFGIADQGIQALDDLAAFLTGTPRRQIAGTPGPESWLLGQAKTLQRNADASMPTLPADAGNIERGVWSGFQSLGQNLSTLPLALIDPALMLGTMGGMQGGQSYAKAREAGASPLKAGAFGAADATAEIVTERFAGAFGFMNQVMAGAAPSKLFMYELLKEVPGEMAATLWQNFNEWATLNPEKPLADWVREQPDAAAQTIVATLVGGAGQVGAVHAVRKAAGVDTEAQRAEAAAAALEQLRAAAAGSKLRERAPDTFEAFMQQATDDGPLEKVWIDAAALQQSGVAEQLMQLSPAVAQQLPAALASGGSVAIPTAELVGRLDQAGLAQPLVDHLRTEAGGFSRAEAQQYLEQRGEQLRQDVERTLAERQADDTFKGSRDEVQALVHQELERAGRFTADVNQAYASLMANFYAAQAARMGMTPRALFDQFPVRVTAQMGGEQALGQGAVETEAFRAWFGDSKAVDAEGKPLVLYHGTPDMRFLNEDGVFATMKERMLRYGATPESKRAAMNERAFFFTTSRAVAKTYADPRRAFDYQNADEGVIPAYVSLKNPLEFDAKGKHWREAQAAISKDDFIVAAKKAGHDGVVIRNVRDSYDSMQTGRDPTSDVYVAFTSNQIKHAERNRGTFDPNDPSILNQETRGTFTPSTNTIALLEKADLSTFLHESGHFYLEVMADLASRENAPPEIVADMNAALKWMGWKGDLAGWREASLEDRREYHEKFARGFEAYLFEGRAPSLEMQSLFQRFRGWLLNVYRSLKALNVQLDDEVRGVFDRMLASTEAIKEMEALRGFTPAFTPEEAAKLGVDYQAYHEAGMQATQDAIEDLQGRGLRDMQWLANARARELKRLQREAAAKRREIRAEVRLEVMADPLYQAWQFLTRRGPKEETATGEKPKAVKGLDVTRDSLLVAIAKLGGINRASAVRDLSVSEDTLAIKGEVFGKPPFRKEGGMSVDDMREALQEQGYLYNVDEHGRTEIRELEERLHDELAGKPQYSLRRDYSEAQREPLIGDVAYGKLRTSDVEAISPADLNALKARKMVQESGGLHPDVVAEHFGFTSGSELIQRLAAANAPNEVIEALTDQRMLERFGELADQQALERAADEAVHNEARARFIATELNALQRAIDVREAAGTDKRGRARSVAVLPKLARQFADSVIGRTKVRDLAPGQFTRAEARAAKEALAAVKKGDTAAAAEAKRQQLLNNTAARAALDARTEVDRIVQYLKQFDRDGTRRALDPAYVDQIDRLLERFDLRQRSLRAVDKAKTLAAWVDSQREMGLEPDIPPELLNEAYRTSYKDLTVDELRGLRDTVKQIEHLGRLKNKLLTAKTQREWEAIRDELADSINQHARGRKADTRTPATVLGKALLAVRNFGAAHIKAATWARILDGGRDGGPVWEYLVRSANERADMEATRRAQATEQLHTILAPLLARGGLGGKGTFYASIGRSMNREQVLAMALNTGNEGNVQRMLGGEGWTRAQILPVLQTLTAEDWHAVQAVWDHFEQYRPEIGAKERRVYGKEPAWVDPGGPVAELFGTAALPAAEGVKGGYFPIKYDPLASNRAEQHNDAEAAKRQLQGAYTSATTRRGFTKARVEEVSGRPLLYSLAAVYSGTNDVIHDLAWHEWLIDANKILRSEKIDAAIRTQYGPEVVRQFKTWVRDVAAGEQGLQAELDSALGRIRQGVSAAGLGFNVMSAVMQPLGLTQSIVRVGAGWVAKGLGQYITGPIDATREVNAKSEFMASRARTRFRELNELRNQVEGQSKGRELLGRYAYWLMMRCQQMVDTPTWLGAYEKAISEGNAEDRAIALADQAVRDAQGGGQVSDLSAVERPENKGLKIFTVFYSFMNTALNLGYSQAKTADTPAKKAKLAADMVLLYVVPAVLGAALKDALTPGDSGDWDDPDKLAKKLLAEQMSYLFGLMVVVREFAEAGKAVAGLESRDYAGPAGVRMVVDAQKFGKQASQGEFDDAFRKATVNLVGDLFGLPAAQVNRTITGAVALHEGKTDNPAALVFGFQEKR